MVEWKKFKNRNKHAKLVLVDLAANPTTQAPSKDNSVLNISGFGDSVFQVIQSFLLGGDSSAWIKKINDVAEFDAGQFVGCV